MNDALKKAIIFGVVALLLFGAGFFGGYIIRKEIDNKRVREYRDTVNRLGNEIDYISSLNTKLRESNQKLDKRLGELTDSLRLAQSRVEKARRIITELGKGIQGASGDVREIIRAVRSVISKIEQLGEP